MRIGIDLRPLATASGRRGVGTWLRGLVEALLAARDPGEELVLFHSAGAGDGLPAVWLRDPGVEAIALAWPRRAATFWDQLLWPAAMARARLDVFHASFWTLPVTAAALRWPIVQTLQDLTPIKVQGSVTRRQEMVFRINFACARFARLVLVPSQATFDDAVALAGLDATRLRLVPHASEPAPALLAQAAERVAPLRSRLGLDGPYLVHTGGVDRVKNLETAISALALLGPGVRLAVSGDPGVLAAALRERAAAAGIASRLVFTGFLDEPDLFALYTGARALLYPSRNEGFGLPVLEAMACGTPVIAARAGSLPEVGGDACLYVDAEDARGLAAAAASLLDDEGVRARLSARGRERAAHFTWREAARLTLAAYHEAAGR